MTPSEAITYQVVYLQHLAHRFAESEADAPSIISPPPLRELIAMRVAPLSPAARRVLQRLAVLGPCCTHDRLKALWPAADDLDGPLQQLLDRGLCDMWTSPETAEMHYTLSHVLIAVEAEQSES